MKNIILESGSCRGTKTNPSLATDPAHLATHDCYQCADDNNKWYCEPKSNTPTPSPSAGETPPPTPSASEGTPPPTPTPTPSDGGIHIPELPELPELPNLEGLITNAWGKITSWFGSRVDETGNWMKDKFTKSDIERAQEDCYKVPFKDEDSAKKALESGDIVDYYQLKDKDNKVVFLGKAWDCDNKGGTPPCFKKLSSGKYDSEKEAYIEEYFEELNDAGVYEYYCNGSVAFSPYYESDATGGYVESGRPKVWYKWDPKTGVINKS